MKICIVSCEYPPFGGGGIGTYSWNMSRFLAEAGHEVHVIANAWPDYAAKNPAFVKRIDEIPNLTVHRVDAITDKYGPRPPYDVDESPIGKVCRWWDSSLFWSYLAAEELEKVVREHQVEVVEYPECYAEGYIAMRRRQHGLAEVDVPMTVTLHSPIHEVTLYNMYRMYEGWFRRRTYSEEYCILHADMLSCPSRSLVDIVNERMGLDPAEHPCEVIHNPMDFEALPEIETAGAAEEPMSLLFAGRIEPRKGIKYLVDAACLILDKYPSLKVHLIGKDCDAGEAPGSTIEFVSRRIPDRLRDRFVFEGLRPRHEVLARYATATAVVLPAPWDNFPYTCCEAMAYGACVVASDFGGMAEMIEHGTSGMLFPTTNVPALARTLQTVLDDPELRRTLRKNAGPRIREVCDPKLAVKKRIAHYQRTIERHGRRRKARLAARGRVPATARKATLAVYLPNHTSETALRTTIRSVQTAAERAGIEPDVSILGTKRHHTLTTPPYRVHLENSGLESDESALALWLDRLAKHPPDYLMTLWPGEQLGEEYLVRTQRALEENPGAAWATTWMESCHQGSQEPYAGFDFSTPLELMFYHAVPFALVRYDLFQKVGGWNLELPTGWRQWDLWLAFHQAGHDGIVLPLWQGKFIPYSGIKLDVPVHQKAHELAMERVAKRNRLLFDRHSTEMWISRSAAPIIVHVKVPAPVPKPIPYRIVRFALRQVGLWREPPPAPE